MVPQMLSSIITLMMVTYNRKELTKLTLNNIVNTDCKFNIVFIDNGSTDKTLEFLHNFKSDKHKNIKEIIVKENGANKGIAVARNQALVIADDLNTDYYVTIDNDINVPHKNWLSECVEILEANKDYAAIGVSFENVAYPLVTANSKTFQRKARGNLGTALMCFPKSIHKLLGFFNYKDYSKYYGLEDSDFGARIWLGLKLKLGYLKGPGIHLGSDDNDKGEYRKFKTEEHNKYL